MNRISLSQQAVSLQVDITTGGRADSFQLDNTEILAQDKHLNHSWGSTFWLSPQSIWQWPPTPEHDHLPYNVVKSSDSWLHIKSDIGCNSRIDKTFQFLNDSYSTLKRGYRISVEDQFEEIAPWEITRVPAEGIVFFPVNRDNISAVVGAPDYSVTDDNILWMEFDKATQVEEGKINADGQQGWLAYVNHNILFLKIFDNVLPENFVTGEADVEIYQSGDFPYIELEIQGAKHQLSKGEHIDWQSYWRAIPIPSHITLTRDNQQLVEFARSHAQIKE